MYRPSIEALSLPKRSDRENYRVSNIFVFYKHHITIVYENRTEFRESDLVEVRFFPLTFPLFFQEEEI